MINKEKIINYNINFDIKDYFILSVIATIVDENHIFFRKIARRNNLITCNSKVLLKKFNDYYFNEEQNTIDFSYLEFYTMVSLLECIVMNPKNFDNILNPLFSYTDVDLNDLITLFNKIESVILKEEPLYSLYKKTNN